MKKITSHLIIIFVATIGFSFASDPCTCTCTTAISPLDNWGHCKATNYGDECFAGKADPGCDGDMCSSID